MINKISHVIIFLSIIIKSDAQTYQLHTSSPYPGLGSYSTNFCDAFSFTRNTASLASLKSFTAGVYTEKNILINELHNHSAVAVIPFNGGVVGLNLNYFGNSSFNESQIGLAYGKRLGKIDLGIRFNYLRVTIPGYGSDGGIALEGGILMHLTPQFTAGINLYNPSRQGFLRNKEEKFPCIYKMGFGYEASDKIMVSSELIKQEEQKPDVHVAMQYNFGKKFFARLGILTATGTLYAGSGWSFNHFRIDINMRYHPYLGISPGLMLLFTSSEKEED